MKFGSLELDGFAANFKIILALEAPRTGAYGRALAGLARELELAPRSARLHALKGKALSNLSRFPEARRALGRSLALDGSAALTRAWLGQAHLSENRVGPAARELDRALALDPSCAWAYFFRAAVRHVMGRPQEVEEDLKRALALDGGGEAGAAGQAFLALLDAQAGRCDEGLRRIDLVVRRYPGRVWPFALRAVVRRFGGDLPAALGDLDAALRDRGAAGWIALERATLLEGSGDLPGALRDVARVLGRDGPSAPLHLRRGRLLLALERPGEALKDFLAALRLEPGPEVRGFGLELVSALKARGRKSQALRALRALCRALPWDGETMLFLGQLTDEPGVFRKAAAALGRALAKDRRSPALWLLLARAESQCRRLPRAEAAARRAVRLFAGSVEAQRFLAAILLERGKLEAAVAPARAAAGLAPDSAELRTFLEELLARLARRGEADLEDRLAQAKRLGEQGRLAAMRAVLRAAARRAKASPPGGVHGWLQRFRLAVGLGDYDQAAACGEAVLDASRKTEHVTWLKWPFCFPEPALASLPGAYRRRMVAALDRHLARTRSPWGHLYRGILGDRPMADFERLADFPAPRYGWMRYRLGKRLLHPGFDRDRALKEFELSAHWSTPGDWQAQCNIGELLICSGDRHGGLAAFEAAGKMVTERERPELLTWKGEMLLWVGDYREALAALEEGIRQGAGRQLGHCWKGAALMKLGRYARALKALDRGISLVPGDLEAKVWRVETLYRMGDLRAAKRGLAALRPTPGLYIDVLSGLVHRASGDSGKLREAFLRIPKSVSLYAAGKLGLDPAADTDAGKILEGILTLSRGVRREGYELAVWMR